MPKLYTPNTWVDEILAGAERYHIKDNGGTPIESNVQIDLATSVATAGTPVDAEKMNNIEDGIDALDTLLSGILSAATQLTIASDAISITQSNHKLQPETGTADNLSTINGTSAGQSGILYPADFGTDTITIKHNVGNILCMGGSDITLSTGCVFWYSDGTKVFVGGDGGGGGGVSDGDKGDITVSGGGGTWNIDNGAITLAKMADMATASLLGRNTAGTGAPEVLSAAIARALLDLEVGTDVQAYSAVLTTLAGASANGQSLITAANYAAMKALLDLEIGTDVQAYHARLADLAGITYAQGDILYFNGTNIVKLAAGTSGQFLKTQGAGANPLWATIPGGGDLLAANNLSDVASAATARTNLGLAIGTNVQAWDADLDTWATKTPPSGTPVGTTDSQTLSGKTLTNPAMTSQALTDGATINWDANSGAHATVTVAGNRTFAAPTNLKTGGIYILKVTQDETGGRNPTWNAVFKNLPQIDLVASAVTELIFVSDGTNLYYAGGMPSIDPPTETITSSATPTPTAAINGLIYTVSALAAAATFGVPGGSPKNGYKLLMRVKDNATARALSFNAIYRAMGVSLPTTTVISKWLVMLFVYNSTDTKWDLMAVANEA